MTPRRLDPATVGEKLRLLDEALEDLESLGEVDAAHLRSDRATRRIVERCIAHLVDVAAQINAHAAAAITGDAPRDLSESFDRAAEAGLIEDDLAVALRPSAGMRNVIVRAYDELDLDRVAGALPLAVDGYRKYVKQVARFLADRCEDD
ncbi:MAG: type VII toxin-antitoxin system HepT family RNase toxin [Egibacteraceae bacterium]